MQEEVICPYPGLRPFNEDESIFFKGREEHIEQIVKQLEEKKFLMLTGASGDGKSSLVYAGVIPNARAGFFKAKFNNWIVADFRPEREPLKNMAQAIGEQLKLKDITKVEKELSYGFSSLIDIYKASPYWVDQQSETFTTLSTDEQKKAKRKGANLLILVDQFEEFFTNPENYHNGKTSIESQAVVNSLLETTRLSIEQDVPIYIVCTMRSDYIGQCASFRGLPEYIGYSQFFVPRLKRKEIYQVIEEPAQLNGNKISKRLVEMLINEMNDGIDQLPVLQHALNQIWQKAERGQVEMDLIHFAKINGIPRNQLTSEDKEVFEQWFNQLPEFKKDFFKQSSLGDVLDAHANELFETANSSSGKVSSEDAKLIVETAFKCLTKIDEARAVRNRMTLQEVTQIINKTHITTTTVAQVLYLFRIQGNTFLKPFIFTESDAIELSDYAVLDITHESLIRNWKKLTDWAKEEYDNLLTWQDFNKQLQRWVASKKSSGYLLPIGPLTFFENWFTEVKPNKYWLARYDEREISKEQKLADAEETLTNAAQFIKKSARRLFVNRTVIKYGADKLIAAFGILLLVTSCTYFFFDYRKKQNEYVINQIQEKSEELLKSKYIKNRIKAEYILASERLNPGIYKELLKNIDSDSSQIEVVRNMFSICLGYQENKSNNEPNNPLVGVLFNEQLSLIETKNVFKTNESLVININNILSTVYGHIVLKRNKFPITEDGTYLKFCNNTYDGFVKLLSDTAALKKIEIEKFNRLLQIMPEVVDYDTAKIKLITKMISPFEMEQGRITFNILFPKEKTVQQNWSSSLTHNGGFYQLANLYALSNDFENLNKSFDSLVFHNKNFLNVGYGYTYNRFLYDLVITNKLFSKEGIAFISKIESKLSVKKNYSLNILMLNNLLSDKLDIYQWTLQNFTNQNYRSSDLQIQLERISYGQINDLADGIIGQMLASNNVVSDEKNYLAALLYKAKAFANNKQENLNYDLINESMQKSLNFYDKVSSDYLKADITIGEGTEVKSIQRSKIYKFGGLVSLTNGWDPFAEYYSINNYKYKSVFIDYVIKEKGLVPFYLTNDSDAEILNDFLLSYFSVFKLIGEEEKVINLKPFEESILTKTMHKKVDSDLLLAFMASYYYIQKNESKANEFARLVNFKTFLNKEKIDKENNAYKYYNVSTSLLSYFWSKGVVSSSNHENNTKWDSKWDSAFVFMKTYPNEFQMRNSMLKNIDSLQRQKNEVAYLAILDTLLNGYIVKTPKFGNKIFQILGRLATTEGDRIAMFLMKDKPDNIKPACLNFFVDGISHSGYYYKAITYIPDYISSSSQLSLYTTILRNEIKRNKKIKLDGWSVMDNPIEDNWTSGAYENSDNDGGIFYSEF
jgi:hypothetical protein